ncbi:hypothetical protein [Sphingosinithalassobacter portus]|uniref:hypothetical protein n=1 Tax=Stakelama portus TaxID=2676234 RepID=UPI000D6DF724|nr:hypothetical protein [Sphingosinithalassobacter portus]
MTAVIKSRLATGIRAYAAAPKTTADADQHVSALDLKDVEIDRLRGEIARLSEGLKRYEAGNAEAIREARKAALAEGQAQAARDAEAQLAIFRDAAKAAISDFQARMTELDALAPMLIHAVLQKLFGDPANWSRMVEPMVLRALRDLRTKSVVAIEVSPRDFATLPQDGALAQGEYQLGFGHDLHAGQCRICCRMQEIALDVREQRDAILALLSEMERVSC